MRNSKIILGAYATVLMTLSASADAAGLGKLTVLSSLGEPLRAEIEVLDVADLDLSTLKANLASGEAFRQSGIERVPTLFSVHFAIEKKKRDGVVIKLSSPQSISDPFLDFLVEFQWPTGRLVREYTVLLDPPGFAKQEAVAPVALPGVAEKVGKPVAAPEPAPLPPPEKAKPEPKAAPSRKTVASEKPRGDKYGPVKKGQTLYQIAGEVKPAEVSLEEMLVALYRSNPNAFAGKNMNRLVTGKILNVPSAEEAEKISQPEAKKEIHAQVSDWKAYREKLAAAVEAAPAPAGKEEPAKQVATGKITAKTEEKAAPKPSQDVLKLSKAEAGKGAAAKTGGDKLQAMQEDLLAKEKTIKDANERIAQLEKTVKDMQRLLEVKNQNLAAMQQPAPAKAEPAKPEQKEVPKPELKPEEKKAEAPPAPKPAEVKPVEKPKPKPVAKPEPKPEPEPEPSLVDTIMGEPMYLGGLGALVLLLIGGVLMAVRKIREKRMAGFQTSMLSAGDLVAPAEKAGAAASDTSFLTDFSQAGLGTIDTNEVDPIAEAEVYMAYGRDGQAEEILKEAMTKDPHRYEIHLKLLEIYAGRKNLSAFETLATELYAALEGQHSPIWDKAAQMGHVLDPRNPLYGTTPAVPAEGEMEKTMVLTPAKMEALHEAAAAEGEGALADLDFDLGTMSEQPRAEQAAELDIDVGEPAAEEEEMLDVSLPGEEALDLAPGESSPAQEAAPVHAEEEVGLDFILEEPSLAASAPAQEEKTPAAAVPSDMEALDFDFESLNVPPSAEPAAVEPEAGMEDILEMAKLAEPEAEVVPAPEIREEPAEVGLDMGFEMPVTEVSPVAEEVSLEMPSAELEMPEFEAPAMEETIEAAPPPVAEADAAGLDFDFNLEEPAKVEEAEPPQPAVPELDLSGISLDLEEPAPVVESLADVAVDEGRWQEAATKLDLAKAYMEMGDREGAREILQEVLKEGNDQQKQDAQSMLSELS